ncbi:MAG: FliI/YscN family ATPase [Candidatus Eremiobacterota bacterium]
MRTFEELHRWIKTSRSLQTLELLGEVRQVVGTLVESAGPLASVGDLCTLEVGGRTAVPAEVVGFRDRRVLLMPLCATAGISPGCTVRPMGHGFKLGFSRALVGRVLDGMGKPMDGRPLPPPERWLSVDGAPPHALERPPIQEPFQTGIRAIDGLLTMGKGQRLGLFAGSGVGKSTLMGMVARNSSAQVNVIGLIGERGREVRDFLERTLGPEGLSRSVVVAATSDQSPLARIKGALLATALAEAFRDGGQDVLLMLDSVTRIAHAQREIGLAVGEPPTTRGYTPSVFSLLPRLLERSGSGPSGHITALYTVLVEGDDMQEPVADTVRGILDGHLVLRRELAHQNHYPALDVLQSVSRLMNELVSPEQRREAARVRQVLSVCHEARDLLSLGAYVPGNSPEIDRALELKPRVDAFLRQEVGEAATWEDTRAWLASVGGEES